MPLSQKEKIAIVGKLTDFLRKNVTRVRDSGMIPLIDAEEMTKLLEDVVAGTTPHREDPGSSFRRAQIGARAPHAVFSLPIEWGTKDPATS